MGYNVSEEKRNEWKQKAIDNQIKARELIKQISDGYTKDPDQLAELLAFASKFYKYSINNSELIKAQNPGAMFVQSFEAWKHMDANVKKGEHGLKIWVPVKVTVLFPPGEEPVPLSEATEAQKMDYESGIIPGKQALRYKIGTVFDISQTNYPVEKLPELYSMGYSSEQHSLISKGLIKFCEYHGVKVVNEDLESIALRGYYSADSKKIAINNLAQDTQYLSTLTHEIGHMLQEHDTRDISASQKEFEADCISVVLQSYFGIELTELRKKHLSEHYKVFISEVKKDNPNITDDECIKLVDGVMDASLKVFRQFAEEIKALVDDEIKTQENNKKNDISLSTNQSDFSYEFSFTVNECNEFPSMGCSYTGIKTPEEALKVCLDIPEYKRSLISGIELVRTDNLGNEASMPLSHGKTVELDGLEYYLTHTADKEGSKLIKTFCYEARNKGFDVKGSCTIYNLEKLSEEQFRPAMAQNTTPSLEQRKMAVTGANRRHRG